MRAKDIMTTPVVTVGRRTTLKEAASLLVRHDISALPVVDASGVLAGIVSEADLVTLQMPDPRAQLRPTTMRKPTPTMVGQVMTEAVVTVTPDADVAEVARTMLERNVKRLPVVSDGQVVGIISRRDVIRVLARPDASIAAELEAMLDDAILLIGRFEAAVRDGIVTLDGPPDPDGRRLAALVARSIPGVTGVRFVGDP